MSEVVIFSVGSLFFVATSWATLSFGLTRIAELKRRELEDAGVKIEATESGYTEIYRMNDDYRSADSPSISV